MAYVPAVDCITLVATYTQGADEIGSNVLAFKALSDMTQVNMQAAITAFADLWAEDAAPYVCNTVKLARVTATDKTTQTGFQIVDELSGGISGSNTGAKLPNNVTLATAFKSIYAGRTRRGRVYWVGLGENLVTDDDVLPTPAEGIRVFWETMGAVLTSGDWQHVILSYISNGVARTEALATDVTTYVNTNTHVDTQRRRLLK